MHESNFLPPLIKALALGIQAGAFGWAVAQGRWAMRRNAFWTIIAIYLAASGVEYLARFIIWYDT